MAVGKCLRTFDHTAVWRCGVLSLVGRWIGHVCTSLEPVGKVGAEVKMLLFSTIQNLPPGEVNKI